MLVHPTDICISPDTTFMIFYFNYFCFVSFDVSFKKKELCYHRQEEITPSYKILIGRADAEAEAPILWPPDAKSRLIGRL